MTARFAIRMAAVLAGLILLSSCSIAQSSDGDASQQPGFTLHSYARAILTDVTVTDSHGNPVTGLRASDFQLSDNGAPQSITSFDEHLQPASGAPAPVSGQVAPAIYSNDYMEHLPPVLNVVIIDMASYHFAQVGYTWYELNRFIKQLPQQQQVAIYVRTAADLMLLQPFTSDHDRLLAAMRHAVNRFWMNPGLAEPSGMMTLHAMASELAYLPGRKNVLWFTAGSVSQMRADGTVFEDRTDIKRVYDELEAARIAVYPIDTAGVTGLMGNYDAWNEVAKATGGRAFYLNNRLDKIAEQIVNTDGDYYTLSYSPPDAHFDGKWHKVEIKLKDGRRKLQLGYRQGYFADDMRDIWQSGSPPRSQSEEAKLDASDASRRLDNQPNPSNPPIIFQVEVQPATAMAADPLPALLPTTQLMHRKRSTPYIVRYAIPANDIATTTIDGVVHAEIGVQLIALDEYGEVLTRDADHISVKRNEGDMRADPGAPIVLEQRTYLPKGDNDLFCLVWDMSSHRMGSIEVPVWRKKNAK